MEHLIILILERTVGRDGSFRKNLCLRRPFQSKWAERYDNIWFFSLGVQLVYIRDLKINPIMLSNESRQYETFFSSHLYAARSIVHRFMQNGFQKKRNRNCTNLKV